MGSSLQVTITGSQIIYHAIALSTNLIQLANQLALGNGSNQTIQGVISDNTDTGSLYKQGSGTLTLTGTNTFTGGASIGAGILNINADAALGHASGPFTFIAMGSGTLQAAAPLTLADRTINLTGNGRFDTAGFASTIGGSITGASLFTVLSSGAPNTLTLTNSDNDYLGGTTIGAALGLYPATLALTGVGTAGSQESDMGSGLFTINAGSTFDISGVSGTSVIIGDLSGAGSIKLATGKTLAVGTDSGAATTFSGSTQATAGTLLKQGSNTLYLAGNNLHTTGTTLYQGTLNITNNNNLGNGGTFTVYGGTTLQAGALTVLGVRGFTLAGTGDSPIIDTLGNTMSITTDILAGSTGLGITKIGSGLLTLTGANTFTGGLYIAGGTVNVTTDGGLGASGGVVVFEENGTILQAGASLTLGASRTIDLLGNGTFDTNGFSSTVAGPIIGSTDSLFTVIGSSGSTNILILSNGGNSYRGGTTIGAGALMSPATLLLTGSGTAGGTSAGLGTGVFTINAGSTFDISGVSGTSVIIGDLSGAGSIKLATGKTLAVGTDSGAATTFSGSTQATAGTLLKQGSNTLYLAGNNLHTTGTTLYQGTLNITSNNNLGTGGTFTLYQGTTLQAGAPVVSGVRGFTLAASTGDNPIIDTPEGTSMAITTAILAGGTDLGIIKTGAGLLTLTGESTFIGGLTINEGTVNVNSDGVSMGPLGTSASTLYFGEDGTVLQAGAGFAFASARDFELVGSGTIDTNGYTLLQGSGSGYIFGAQLLTVIGNGASPSSLQLNTTNSSGNTYLGGTTIGSGPGLNGATLYLDGTHATAGGTSDGLGTGVFTIYAGSTFDISSSAISGGPIVGDLAGGGAINLGSNTLSVGTSTDDRNTTFSGGTLDTDGTFIKQGTNTLTLTGVNSHTDGTFLNQGTLNISDDSNLGTDGGLFTVAGGSTLQAGAASVVVVRDLTLATGTGDDPTIDTKENALLIDGSILAGGTALGVTKIGFGTLTLDTDSVSTFTGTFDLTEGTTILKGTLASPVLVGSEALLKGTGTISGLVTVNGTLQPGTSIGTENYADGLVVNPGGILSIEIADDGQTSIANVTGLATIGGGTLTIFADPGSYTAPITYPPFLVTTTGVLGKFGPTNLPKFAGLISELIYNLDSVQFALVAPQFTSGSLSGLTGNNGKVAAYLNSIPFGFLGETMVDLVGFSGSTLTNALESISPARSATPIFTSMMMGYTLSTIVSDRITTKRMLRSFETAREVALAKLGTEEFSVDELQASAGEIAGKDKVKTVAAAKCAKAAPKEKPYDLWISGFGDIGTQNAQNQTPQVNFTTGGLLLGFDYDYTDAKNVGLDAALFGLAAAYTHTGFNEQGNAGHGSTNFGNLAIYGTAYFNEWSLQLAMWNGYGNIKNIRNISFPGYAERTTSSHNTYQGDLHARAGYDLNFVKMSTAVTIEPFVALDWVYDCEQNYKESGKGLFAMHYKGRFSSMLRTEIGFNNCFSWIFCRGEFILRDKVSYVNKAPFGVGSVNAQIIGVPNFFTVETFNGNQSLISPSLELAWKGNNNCYGSILYEGEFGSGYMSNEFVGRVGLYF